MYVAAVIFNVFFPIATNIYLQHSVVALAEDLAVVMFFLGVLTRLFVLTRAPPYFIGTIDKKQEA